MPQYPAVAVNIWPQAAALPLGRDRQNGMVTDSPLLRVVRGEPTAEELAALVAVLAARAAASARPERRWRSGWADPATRPRAPLRPGPLAWRRSALPR